MRRMQRLKALPAEDVALVLAAVLVTVWWDRQILFAPHVYQPDTLLLEYWTRRFQDPQLFTDPLTHALLQTAYVPLGDQALYRLASFVVDPLRFGAWGAVVVAPFTTWLVFRIVREHAAWRPGAWFAAALFLLPWSMERFSGTHSRAFEQPIVLLTLLLVLRGRHRWAAIVPVAGALLYPPAALLGVGVVAAASLSVSGRRPAIDRTVAVTAAACAAGVLAILLAPGVLGQPASHLISASAARRYPEFHAHGQMEFFRRSLLVTLRGRYSGFDLKAPGAILVAAAILVLVVRPRNALLVRREVWLAAAVSLVLYGLAWALLFRLYLPNRYTHPIVPIACIVIGVCWRPAWDALAGRLGRWSPLAIAVLLPAAAVWLGVRVFPLGPLMSESQAQAMVGNIDRTLAVAAGVGLLIALAVLAVRGPIGASGGVVFGAVFSAALVAGAVTATAGGRDYVTCGSPHLQSYLRTLPKDAIIAGDPVKLDCVPVEAERPVVISRKLYQAVDGRYLQVIRPRMFAMLHAYYGPSVRAIAGLRPRFGADYLVVQRDVVDARHAPPAYAEMAPFAGVINRILAGRSRAAALALPHGCAVWHRLEITVYDLRCVGRSIAVAQKRTGVAERAAPSSGRPKARSMPARAL
jgi:hypothetical protein